MTSSSLPDVNVWFALLYADHVHRASALTWWNAETCERIGFTRPTQMGVLRLATTAAAMNGRPLTMKAAWKAYDRLFEDERVVIYPEPPNIDAQFREFSKSPIASPKVWADAYLLAFARGHHGQVVTFDKALEDQGTSCLVLG